MRTRVSAAAHAKRVVTEVSESELAASAALASAARRPTRSGGTRTSCSRSARGAARPSRRPRPSSLDAVASLALPGATDALHATLETLRGKAAEAAGEKTLVGKSRGWGLMAARPLRRRDRSRFVAGVADARAPRGRARRGGGFGAMAACPSSRAADAPRRTGRRSAQILAGSRVGASRPRRASSAQRGGRRTTTSGIGGARSTSTSAERAVAGDARARHLAAQLGQGRARAVLQEKMECSAFGRHAQRQPPAPWVRAGVPVHDADAAGDAGSRARAPRRASDGGGVGGEVARLRVGARAAVDR